MEELLEAIESVLFMLLFFETGVRTAFWTPASKKIPMPALPVKCWQRRAKFLLPGNSAQRQAPTWKPSCGRLFGMPDTTVIRAY